MEKLVSNSWSLARTLQFVEVVIADEKIRGFQSIFIALGKLRMKRVHGCVIFSSCWKEKVIAATDRGTALEVLKRSCSVEVQHGSPT